MASSNDPNRDVRRELREEGPPLERREPTARSGEAFETPTAAVPGWAARPLGRGHQRVIIALGTILLLTALGLAIGITAVGDPRAATHNTVTGLGIGAGIWAALTLLIAYFLGGLVSTTVTDRPDRAGALIHGALVWTLGSVFLLWLIGQGISLGLSGLFGALGGLTRTAATVATGAVAGGGDLAQRLGFTDPSRVMDRLDDPQTVSVFAAATGMATEEARTALVQFRDRVAAVRDARTRWPPRRTHLPCAICGPCATAGAEGGGGRAGGRHGELVGDLWGAGADPRGGHAGGTGWEPEPAYLAYAVDAYRGSVAMVNKEKAHKHPVGDEAWPRRSWRAASGFSLHLRRLAPGLNTW